MKEMTIKDTTGSLRISEDVVAKIANIAALEIEGVAAVAPVSFGMKKTGGPYPGRGNGIRVAVQSDVAVISIALVVKPDRKLTELAQNVQKNVKASVQSMTGLAVSKVDVYIANVDLPQ